MARSLSSVKKQIRKLERRYEKTPEKCVLVRARIEREMEHLQAVEKRLESLL